jgi:hypothetical protein
MVIAATGIDSACTKFLHAFRRTDINAKHSAILLSYGGCL